MNVLSVKRAGSTRFGMIDTLSDALLKAKWPLYIALADYGLRVVPRALQNYLSGDHPCVVMHALKLHTFRRHKATTEGDGLFC